MKRERTAKGPRVPMRAAARLAASSCGTYSSLSPLDLLEEH